MKLDIPKFGYLFQDLDGDVMATVDDCETCNIANWWLITGTYVQVAEGVRNDNWKDTRIDLETDNYEFEDGIFGGRRNNGILYNPFAWCDDRFIYWHIHCTINN